MERLFEFPAEVVSKIFEKAGYETVQTLRKTSWELRNFIDDSSPNLRIQSILIRMVRSTEIHLAVKFWDSKNSLDVRYTQEMEHCSVVKDALTRNRREVILENQNHVEVFFKDIEILRKYLDHPKVILEKFSIKFSIKDPFNLIERIRNILRTGHPLKVEKLHLKISASSQFYEIFSNLAPGVLKDIKVEFQSDWEGPHEGFLNLDEVVTLDAWEQAKTVDILNFYVTNPSRFLHFTKVKVDFTWMTMEEYMMIRNNILHSDSPRCFSCQYSDEEPGTFRKILESLGGITVPLVSSLFVASLDIQLPENSEDGLVTDLGHSGFTLKKNWNVDKLRNFIDHFFDEELENGA